MLSMLRRASALVESQTLDFLDVGIANLVIVRLMTSCQAGGSCRTVSLDTASSCTSRVEFTNVYHASLCAMT
jgi:hypothetical protein